jgi:septal ring factor EnvC (AmiA/AmiB activator)
MYMRGSRLVAALVTAVMLVQPVAAIGQGQGDIDGKRSDLDELQRRIRELQQEVAETEETRSGAAAALAEAERAVSRAQRSLRQAEAERSATEAALAALEAEQQEVERRIGGRQEELAVWLRRHYMHGAGDGVAPLLAARDPGQLARDVHYLEHLGRARLALIEQLRRDLGEKAARAADISARHDRLAALESERRSRQAEFEAVQAERKAALEAISEQLKSRQQEVVALREDEGRLAALIETLARRARLQAAREAARREAERRAAEQRVAEQRAAAQRAAAQQAAAERAAAQRAAASRIEVVPPAAPPPPARPEAEPVVGEARSAAAPTPTGVGFAQLRGQLGSPVRGELVGRFGAPRAQGGTTWKGIFIRAANGSEVRAVAAGEVVFSDWLRGYGNLLIIDHGNGYLSVYGNNDALLKETGARVAGGDAIASVGASGGAPESGLYFEIRHQGRPLNPMQWVRLN